MNDRQYAAIIRKLTRERRAIEREYWIAHDVWAVKAKSLSIQLRAVGEEMHAIDLAVINGAWSHRA